MLSRFHRLLERNGRTDRRTDKQTDRHICHINIARDDNELKINRLVSMIGPVQSSDP